MGEAANSGLSSIQLAKIVNINTISLQAATCAYFRKCERPRCLCSKNFGLNLLTTLLRGSCGIIASA
jgi:hypothetical protein